jgi:hypothetical protein
MLTAALVLAVSAGLAAQKTTRLKVGRGGSPHDRTEWSIGGATIAIEYGRPSMKGRKIFGGLEPYGKVWRTGADEATMLETDKTLEIGGVAVPAGKYSLYTWIDEKAWKLIVNKQVGQWGTQYDQSMDLARIDMTKRTLQTPVEQLTISIDPQKSGGLLKIAWETTEVSVPIVVKG